MVESCEDVMKVFASFGCQAHEVISPTWPLYDSSKRGSSVVERGGLWLDEDTHAVFFISRMYGSPLINVALRIRMC